MKIDPCFYKVLAFAAGQALLYIFYRLGRDDPDPVARYILYFSGFNLMMFTLTLA